MTYDSPHLPGPAVSPSAAPRNGASVRVMTTEGPRVLMFGSRRSPLDLEDRITFLLQRLPPDDPHARFLRLLLARLPRRPDGSINLDALEDVARQIDSEIRGAPPGLIDLLPTRKFERSCLPTEDARKEEHTQ